MLAEPGVIQKELIRRIGATQPAIAWHAERLESAGLVGRDQQGHQGQYYPNPREPLVERYDSRAAVEVA